MSRKVQRNLDRSVLRKQDPGFRETDDVHKEESTDDLATPSSHPVCATFSGCEEFVNRIKVPKEILLQFSCF